jgi:hypothetical protein
MRMLLTILAVVLCPGLLPLALCGPAPAPTAVAVVPTDTLMPTVTAMPTFTLAATATATQPAAPCPPYPAAPA